MRIKEFQHEPVKPDTYEASMARNQLMRIGKHAIKLHNMIDDAAEMESWVAKKIDLAGDYVKKVYNYTEGEKAGLYDDGGMTEIKKMPKGTGTMYGIKEDQTTIEVKAILDKHGIKSTDDIEYGSDAFSDLFDYFSSDPDEMPYGVQKARTGMPDVWIADRLIDLGLLKEDSPFGSGMDLVRMAVMRKWISAEEYVNYAKELKAAGEETAEHYDDWPEGEGFGSSDGNFAIRDMMSAAGYEFDDKDTSGSFIVTKMPEKLEKMGIKNALMRDTVTKDSLEARLETKLRESRDQIGDYAREIKSGRIVRIVDYTDDDEGIYTISYGEDKGENDVTAKDLKFLDQTGVDQEEIGKFDEDKDFDFENSNQYADNVEKYGDVDKTPLTPQERQQFKKWLNDTANNYFSRALEGIEEIGDDPDNFNDEQKKLIPKIKAYLKQSHSKRDLEGFVDDVLDVEKKFGDEDLLMNDDGYTQAKDFSQQALNYMSGLTKLSSQDYTVKTIRGVLDYIDDDPHISSAMLVFQQDFEGTPLQRKVSRVEASESVSEDAGEGHMSKSTLYHTAKYAIALMDMIKPGDDLEGWVQSKLNKAADYLQGVYNYEEYQKLNPYREELDSSLMQKHAQVVQKNIDEILAKETQVDDIDTKPGMMRILSKRVNEVEKEIAKKTRKKTDESGILYRAGVKKLPTH